jgi:hypothetical protein
MSWKYTDISDEFIELFFSSNVSISFRKLVIFLEATECHNPEENSPKYHRSDDTKIYLVCIFGQSVPV